MKKSYQTPEIGYGETDLQAMLLPLSLPSSPSGPSMGARQRETEIIQEGQDSEEVLW